jgi:hypothetical protein
MHPKRRAVEVSGEQTINIQEKEQKIKELDDLINEMEENKSKENQKTIN